MPQDDRKLKTEEIAHAVPRADAPVRVCAVLEDVRSRHNVGAFFRTADAFAVERLWLCGFTPQPPHREIDKTALGATNSVTWEHRADALDVVLGLQQAGYRVLAVEQTVGALPLHQVHPQPGHPLALVFGNELSGVSDPVVAACDACVMIPQHGAKHSLNVAVCAGIVLWWLAGSVAHGRGMVSRGGDLT